MRMAGKSSGGAIQRAAQALATADGVAHIAFFSVFAYRVITGNGFRIVQGLFALLSLVGVAAGVVGWALARHGGKGKGHTMGLWCIATSTALAGVLLMVASWTGD